jgi:hypothetical protein
MYAEIIRKAYENGKRAFAVRSLTNDEHYNIGDECRESYDWDFENDCSTYITTGQTAGGTCGVKIPNDFWFDGNDDEDIENAVKASIDLACEYGSDLVIIAGDCDICCNYSVDDENEARITNAYVIAEVR